MKNIRWLGLCLLAFSGPAMASPLPSYAPYPFEAMGQQFQDLYGAVNAQVQSAALNNTSCSGTTTATCQGLRIQVSYTGLTTAAGVTSVAQTVTDASVSSSTPVNCFVNGYAGTGNPLAVNVVPGTGSFTYQIENTHATAALNATVVTVCNVWP